MKRIIVSILVVLGIFGWQPTTALALPSDSATVTATILAGTSTLVVTEASIAFGNITPVGLDHRKAAGPLTVSFFAGTSPYNIQIHTTHGVDTGADDRGGLIGAVDGTTLLAMKCWTANYGPAPGFTPDPDCAAPDAENDTYWTPDPVAGDGWNWIFDTRGVARRELIDETAEITGGFTLYLAVDAGGMVPQAYSGEVTIEFVAE